MLALLDGQVEKEQSLASFHVVLTQISFPPGSDDVDVKMWPV